MEFKSILNPYRKSINSFSNIGFLVNDVEILDDCYKPGEFLTERVFVEKKAREFLASFVLMKLSGKSKA